MGRLFIAELHRLFPNLIAKEDVNRVLSGAKGGGTQFPPSKDELWSVLDKSKDFVEEIGTLS